MSKINVNINKLIDLNKLKNIFNIKDVSMAHPNEVKKITGYTIGGVSPVGHLNELKIYIDNNLERCQRYFYQLDGIMGDAFMGTSNTHIRHTNVWFPVTMRDTPTISATWNAGTNPAYQTNTQYAHVEVNIGSNSASASLTSFSASAELT